MRIIFPEILHLKKKLFIPFRFSNITLCCRNVYTFLIKPNTIRPPEPPTQTHTCTPWLNAAFVAATEHQIYGYHRFAQWLTYFSVDWAQQNFGVVRNLKKILDTNKICGNTKTNCKNFIGRSLTKPTYLVLTQPKLKDGKAWNIVNTGKDTHPHTSLVCT